MSKLRYILVIVVLIGITFYAILYSSSVLSSNEYFYTDWVNNRNDLFQVGDNIYLILWKYSDAPFSKTQTILLQSTVRGKRWNQIILPGKGYYLGDQCNKEICSIEEFKGKWKISFYNLGGVKLRDISYRYQRIDKEKYRTSPIPIVCPDGSLLFYTSVTYEKKSRISAFIDNIITLGYGSSPGWTDCIEILPDLMKHETMATHKIAYLRLGNADRILLKGLNVDAVYKVKGYDIKEFDSGEYRITEVSKINDGSEYYSKNNYLVRMENSFTISYDFISDMLLANKPAAQYQLNVGETIKSDVFVKEKHDMIFVVNPGFVNYFLMNIYKMGINNWETTKIKIRNDNVRDIRVIQSGEVLVIVVWYNFNNDVNGNLDIIKMDMRGQLISLESVKAVKATKKQAIVTKGTVGEWD